MRDGSIRCYDLRGIAQGGPGYVTLPILLRAGDRARKARQDAMQAALLATLSLPLLALGILALISYLR